MMPSVHVYGLMGQSMEHHLLLKELQAGSEHNIIVRVKYHSQKSITFLMVALEFAIIYSKSPALILPPLLLVHMCTLEYGLAIW